MSNFKPTVKDLDREIQKIIKFITKLSYYDVTIFNTGLDKSIRYDSPQFSLSVVRGEKFTNINVINNSGKESGAAIMKSFGSNEMSASNLSDLHEWADAILESSDNARRASHLPTVKTIVGWMGL